MTTQFDIVKRLRAVASSRDPGSPQIAADAADEIENLRKEVVRWRCAAEGATDAMNEYKGALEQIAEGRDAGRHDGLSEDCPVHDADTMFAVARAALGQSVLEGGPEAMRDDQLLEHLANFFLAQFGEDAVSVAEWLRESEGIEDVDGFYEAVKSKASL